MEGKTIYDLLRELVNKSNWTTEADKVEYTRVVNLAEQFNMFGNMGLEIHSQMEDKNV
jgi:hypothetical protein